MRLNGHTMTLTSAETRVRWGIHLLAGGNAVFAPLTVSDNLRMAGFEYRKDRTDQDRRVERVLDIFPELRSRLGDTAGDLSGGQQQILGLAMALMHEPEVLLIDELSLGLAPVMVQQLLEVIDRLKAAGQTMIIVEQSLNVALSISDRAIFMEKGRILFEGPAAELLERDDLARAVFLGRGRPSLVLAGIEIPGQVVFIGLIQGLSIGLLALGIVLVYRSSRVINFAVGNIGVLGAAILAMLVINYSWPFWPSVAVAILSVAAFTAAMEATVVTRLFKAPR